MDGPSVAIDQRELARAGVPVTEVRGLPLVTDQLASEIERLDVELQMLVSGLTTVLREPDDPMPGDLSQPETVCSVATAALREQRDRVARMRMYVSEIRGRLDL